mmetsp:Transcript_88065/g.158796  ORF Transcript_88065/g.158796 Transcript_88065/m.158796 type:complete len:209 (-) Transcript_88065:1424-2050(-)
MSALKPRRNFLGLLCGAPCPARPAKLVEGVEAGTLVEEVEVGILPDFRISLAAPAAQVGLDPSPPAAAPPGSTWKAHRSRPAGGSGVDRLPDGPVARSESRSGPCPCQGPWATSMGPAAKALAPCLGLCPWPMVDQRSTQLSTSKAHHATQRPTRKAHHATQLSTRKAHHETQLSTRKAHHAVHGAVAGPSACVAGCPCRTAATRPPP